MINSGDIDCYIDNQMNNLLLKSAEFDHDSEKGNLFFRRACEIAVNIFEKCSLFKTALTEYVSVSAKVIDDSEWFASEYCSSEDGNALGENLINVIKNDTSQNILSDLYNTVYAGIKHWANIFNNTAGEEIYFPAHVSDEKKNSASQLIRNQITALRSDESLNSFTDGADVSHEISASNSFIGSFLLIICAGALGIVLFKVLASKAEGVRHIFSYTQLKEDDREKSPSGIINDADLQPCSYSQTDHFV